MSHPLHAASTSGQHTLPCGGLYGRRMRWLLVSLFAVFAASSACSKTREQPVLPASASPPVPNSLQAPAYAAPTKADKVKLGDRKWGTRAPSPGTLGNPLTQADKAVAMAQAKSLNDHPEGLKRAELQKALDQEMGNLAKCFDDVDTSAAGIYFEADPSGTARGVHVTGAPGPAEQCVKGIMGQLRFPEFQGNPVPVDFPIRISRTVKTVPAPAGNDNQAAGPPNSFVSP